MTKRMPQRNGKKNSKETKNAFATRQHFFSPTAMWRCWRFRMKIKNSYSILLLWCRTTWNSHLRRHQTNGWVRKTMRKHNKKKPNNDDLVDKNASRNRLQTISVYFFRSSSSFLSLACALASLLILTPCWALAPFYQHIFDGKKITIKFPTKKGVHFNSLSLSRFCCRRCLALCLVSFSLFKNIIKSPDIVVVDRRQK